MPRRQAGPSDMKRPGVASCRGRRVARDPAEFMVLRLKVRVKVVRWQQPGSPWRRSAG